MLIRGFSLFVCLMAAAWGQQYTITTVAGNGVSGFNDSSDPTAAQFASPNAVAVDSKGVIYVADTTNRRVRTITGGAVATIAGTGTPGNTGNGAAATSATLDGPAGLAIDSSGAIYVADSNSNVVRKISGGNINAFAGTGNATYSGDGQVATNADLNSPTGLAVDSAGNVYIADTNNNLIRRVDKNGIITTYVGAGATAGRLNHPTGLWIDAAGALYISDSGNRRIAKFANNTFTSIAGNLTAGFSGDGGPATRAMLNNPVGIALDGAGSIYIADSNNGRIRKVTPDGNIFTIAGRGGSSYSGDGGPAISAGLSFPRGVTVGPSGTVYVADTQNNVIRALTPSAPPAITSGGVGNAASGAPRVSPGALASVYGSGFGSSTSTQDAPWPASVNGVSVNVNGTAAPIYYLSPGQINFQVPWATATGTASVTVTVNGGGSNSVSVPVSNAAPGLFFLPGGAAIVQNSNYSLNATDNPAARGETILAYLTGSGPLTPAQKDGVAAPLNSLVNMTSSYSAKIGSADATVSFAGLAPGFVGLVQMNIVVPSSLAPGTYPLTVTVAGEASNSATIAVK
jgi:uncharacterized protein (TIGR03437 family)